MWLNEKLRRILAYVFQRRIDLILCKDLSTPPGHVSSGRLKVVPIRPEHRDALVQYIRQYHVDTAGSLRMLEDCLAQGYAGSLARLDGEIIGYRWWVTHEMRHPQLTMYRLELREDEIFAFGLYIARPFRARGYAGEFLADTHQQLVSQGYRRLYNCVGLNNVPARRLNETHGSTELARHTVITLFSALVLCAGRLLRYNPLWM